MAKKRWGTRLLGNRVVDLSMVVATKVLVYGVMSVAAVSFLWFLLYAYSAIFYPPLAADLSVRADVTMFWIQQSGIVDKALLAGFGLISFIVSVVLVEISLNKLDELTEGIRGGR